MTQTTTSKGALIAYWIVTGLLSAFLLFAAFNHITMQAEAAEATKHLDFPARLLPFMGVMKALAVIVILIGRRGDMTVGAYAGVFFYGLGALATHVTIGDPPQMMIGAILIIVLGLSSYFLWRKTRGRR